MDKFCNNEVYDGIKVFTRLNLLVREMFFLTSEEKKKVLNYITEKSNAYFYNSERKINEGKSYFLPQGKGQK